MPLFVALLRGINVGGKNIIPMKALAKTFVNADLEEVRTYIQSGNVIFTSPERDARVLEDRIERAVAKAHRCESTVVVKSKAQMAKIVAAIPRSWSKADPEKRYNVIFLRHEVDSKKILTELQPKPDIEELTYAPGALFWSASRDTLGKTAMNKLPSHRIYAFVTIRNVNTTRKLYELLGASDA